jgi:phospholipase/carboxylesterase
VPADPPWRLRARPRVDGELLLRPGTTRLQLGRDRDGLVHVPESAADGPVGLVVLLHGAGSQAAAGLALLADEAQARRLVLLAPDSRQATWDLMGSGFGPDVAFLDGALEQVFAGCPVDGRRVALGGFSDGASYALSLGIGNGDLFGHLIAFSPGFALPEGREGAPRVFVTHGVVDRVLPIDRCSRRIVPALRSAGYDVTYEEFPDGHVVPPELARRAADWLG